MITGSSRGSSSSKSSSNCDTAATAAETTPPVVFPSEMSLYIYICDSICCCHSQGPLGELLSLAGNLLTHFINQMPAATREQQATWRIRRGYRSLAPALSVRTKLHPRAPQRRRGRKRGGRERECAAAAAAAVVTPKFSPLSRVPTMT